MTIKWVKTGEAFRALGIGVKHLWKLRDEGLLKQGGSLAQHCPSPGGTAYLPVEPCQS